MINDRAMQWYVCYEPAFAERTDYCHAVIDYRSRAGDEECKSYIIPSNTPPTRRRRRLGGCKFPSLCDGSGKNLLKSERHTFACHYKAQAWTLKSQ